MLHADAKHKKLDEQLAKIKDEKKQLEINLSQKETELAKTQEQLAAALSRIEISNAAAVGEVQKLMAEKVTEAYKEGQRDMKLFLKEMRAMF